MQTYLPARALCSLLLSALLFTLSPFAAVQEPPQLLITELYYNTPGVDSEEEWIEIANLGDQPVQLGAYKLGDEEFPGGGEGMQRFPSDAVLAPQQVIVVAQSATGFWALFGAPPDYELQDSDPAVPDLLPYDDWARGEIALNNEGDEVLLLDGNNVVVDAVSYGESSEFLSPSVSSALRGQSVARFPANCDTDTAADWQPQSTPSPGSIQPHGECAVPSAPEAAAVLPIGEIQGAGKSSPRVNEIVTFEGIVTGVMEDRNTRGAIFYSLYVHDVSGQEDGDPSTSDAIAVFHGSHRPSYVPGDLIRVTGQVTEFFGFTEIDDNDLRIELLETNVNLPPALNLDRTAEASDHYFESLEAMRVQMAEAVVVGPTFSGCGFAVVQGNAPQRFVRQSLDDDFAAIVPILHHSDVNCGAFPQVKAGDVIQGLKGPLIYHFDQFKIVHQFAEELHVMAAEVPALPQPPRLGANEASIATFNLHDHFDSRDNTRSDAELVPDEQAVLSKETKLAMTISDLLGCPTLLAVQEVENAALLQSLAQTLQPMCGFHYDVAHRESADARGIDLGLMVDPRRVQITAADSQQHCSPISTDLPEMGVNCPAGQYPLFSRPPLEVDLLLDGAPYTAIVTHFKSKREGEDETAGRRLAQAGTVAEIVLRRLAAEPEARIVVLGDFNDYALSRPMTILTSGPVALYNTALEVPLQQRYTYNFGGVSQLLDAILISTALESRLVSSTILHVNADFPAGWSSDARTVFRSSDHDIPLIVISTTDAAPPATLAPTATVATGSATPSTPAITALEPSSNSSRQGFALAAFAAVVLGVLVVVRLVYVRR